MYASNTLLTRMNAGFPGFSGATKLVSKRRNTATTWQLQRKVDMALTDADDGDWLSEDEDIVIPAVTAKPWRVLVVDDEPDIHAVTRLGAEQ